LAGLKLGGVEEDERRQKEIKKGIGTYFFRRDKVHQALDVSVHFRS
jgi:hypothetical protein